MYVPNIIIFCRCISLLQAEM